MVEFRFQVHLRYETTWTCLLCSELHRTKFHSDENDVCCSFFNGTFISVKSFDQNWPLFLSLFHSLMPTEYGTLILHFSAFFTVRFFLDNIRFWFTLQISDKKRFVHKIIQWSEFSREKNCLRTYLQISSSIHCILSVFLISNEAKICEWHVLFSCLSNCM